MPFDSPTPTRRKVLDAALELFSERGYFNTAVPDIVSRSGVSTGSIYHHFGDKQGVARALYQQLLEGMDTALADCCQVHESAHDQARAVVELLFAQAEREPLALPGREGLGVPAQVNYVGKGVDAKAHGFAFTGHALVANKILRAGYLWDTIRVRGGAYGAFCMLDALSGSLSLVSYRDPNLDRTLDAFDAAAGYMAALDVGKDELEKTIVGAIGGLDAHMLPDAKGITALKRVLSGQDQDYLQTLRDEVLSCTTADLRGFAEALASLREHGDVVVVGPTEGLEASAKGLDVRTLL